jgi:hypothetical protein
VSLLRRDRRGERRGKLDAEELDAEELGGSWIAMYRKLRRLG